VTAAAGTALAISTSGLTKRFRTGQVAVNGIDLAVEYGSVYGFLGPNGSGKTTTIRLLLGLIRPTSGTFRLLDTAAPAEALSRVGALVEGPAFHPYLTGRDNLRRLDAADRTVDPRTVDVRIDDALDRVGLLSAAGKRYRIFSLGMRARLSIAAALLRPRDLLILDEPTNGLDPQGTREVRSLLTSLSAAGTTVVLSTHLLAEVEQICTHAGVMHLGRLVAQGEMATLRAGSEPRIEIVTSDPAAAATVLTALGLTDIAMPPGAMPSGAMPSGAMPSGAMPSDPVATTASAVARPDAAGAVSGRLGTVEPEAVAPALVAAGVQFRGLRVVAADLEDMFVGLTGEGFDVSK
jgi:ABC-type multidrug transport system ATPase subunit